MRAGLVLLTAFAASVVAAPVPISPTSPIEAPEPLMVREASEGVASPDLENIKRQILENLDAIIEARTISLGVKRQPVQLGTGVEEGNAKYKSNSPSGTFEGAAAKRGSDRSPDGREAAAAKRGSDRSPDGREAAAAKRGSDRSPDGREAAAAKRGSDRSPDGREAAAAKRGFDPYRPSDGIYQATD